MLISLWISQIFISLPTGTHEHDHQMSSYTHRDPEHGPFISVHLVQCIFALPAQKRTPFSPADTALLYANTSMCIAAKN